MPLTLAVVAQRFGKDEELLRIMQGVVFLGNRLFVPASLATLLFGAIMVYSAWRLTDLWILLALCGFALSFLIGVGLIKPRADRLTDMASRDGASPEAIKQCRQIVRIAKFEYAILISIVALMVLKPSLQDATVLLSLALPPAAAGVAFLRPMPD